MPQLDWDPLDFYTCLEVEPEVEEYETYHHYKVDRDGLILDVLVKQLESLVWLSLRLPEWEASLIEFDLFVRGPAQRVYGKANEYLELTDCILTPARPAGFWQSGKFYRNTSEGLTIQIYIKPHIRIVIADREER